MDKCHINYIQMKMIKHLVLLNLREAHRLGYTRLLGCWCT